MSAPPRSSGGCSAMMRAGTGTCPSRRRVRKRISRGSRVRPRFTPDVRAIMRKMYQVVALTVILTTTVLAAPAQRLTPAQHARAGWEAIDAGKFREAADAFTEALRGAPQEPTVTLGAGVAAHRLGQSDTARRYFLDTLRLDPKMTPASVLLGDVLYRA